MRVLQVLGQLAAFSSLATAVDLDGYEYVVVGSGAGGGYVTVIMYTDFFFNNVKQSVGRPPCHCRPQDTSH